MVIRLYLASRGVIKFARRYEGGEEVRDAKSQYKCHHNGVNKSWDITSHDPIFEKAFNESLAGTEAPVLGWKTEIDLLNAAGEEGWQHYMTKKKEFGDFDKIDGAEEMVGLYFRRKIVAEPNS